MQYKILRYNKNQDVYSCISEDGEYCIIDLFINGAFKDSLVANNDRDYFIGKTVEIGELLPLTQFARGKCFIINKK